jgi:hypothetical protein
MRRDVAVPDLGAELSSVDMESDRQEGSAKWKRPITGLFVFTILAIGLVKALLTEVLFADGSLYLTGIVNNHGYSQQPNRHLGVWVMEAPAVLAVHLFDVHSYQLLAILLGIGYLFFPVMLCALAVCMAAKSKPVFVYSALSSAILFCLSGGIGEVALAMSLFILGSTILLIPKKLRILDLIILLAISILAMNTYEAFAIFCPVFIGLLVLHDVRTEQRTRYLYSVPLVALLVVATLINVRTFGQSGTKGEANSLVLTATHFSLYPPQTIHDVTWTLGTLIVLVILAIAGGLCRLPKFARLTIAVAFLLAVLSTWYYNNSVDPGDAFHLRGDAAALMVALAAILGLMLAINRWTDNSLWRGSAGPWSFLVVGGLIAVSLITTVQVASEWSNYQQQFADQENQLQGSNAVTSLKISPNLSNRFSWGWTNSLLGIVLAPQEGRTGVRNVGPQPFVQTLVREADYYAAHPTIENLPKGLLGYSW